MTPGKETQTKSRRRARERKSRDADHQAHPRCPGRFIAIVWPHWKLLSTWRRRFNAELTGIYVEDENLLRLADLPFVQEVGHFSATCRHIKRVDLERQIRGQSRRARRVFTLATQRTHLTWSFRTVRGRVLPEVLAASAEADLLVLGKQGWSLYRHGRVGSTVRGLLPERFGLALIVKEGTRLAAPMAVIYDGSDVADRALIAAEMVRSRLNNNQSLIVLVLPTDAAGCFGPAGTGKIEPGS